MTEKSDSATGGCNVDRDLYALSQLIQWLFRGAIRNGEKIVVGVLAPRMRDLLQRWLNDEFEVPLKRTNRIEMSPERVLGLVAKADKAASHGTERMLKNHVDNSVDVGYDGFVEQEMPVVIWESVK